MFWISWMEPCSPHVGLDEENIRSVCREELCILGKFRKLLETCWNINLLIDRRKNQSEKVLLPTWQIILVLFFYIRMFSLMLMGLTFSWLTSPEAELLPLVSWLSRLLPALWETFVLKSSNRCPETSNRPLIIPDDSAEDSRLLRRGMWSKLNPAEDQLSPEGNKQSWNSE